MNTVHDIKIDFHAAHDSIENICLLGAMVKDEEARKYLHSLNTYLQKIWAEVQKKQYEQL